MNKYIEHTILNNAILSAVKICKNMEDDHCDGCILCEYDCPLIDLKHDLEKVVSNG